MTRRRRSAPPSSTSGAGEASAPPWSPRARAARRWRWPSPSAPSWRSTSCTTSGPPASSLSVSASAGCLRSCCPRAARRRPTSTRPSSRPDCRTSHCWSSRATVHPSCATSGPRRPSTSRICSGDPCDGSSTRAWPMPVSPTRGARWRAACSTSRPLARSTSICRSATRSSGDQGRCRRVGRRSKPSGLRTTARPRCRSTHAEG